MKTLRYLCACAGLSLLCLNFQARAADPPWPPSVFVIAVDPAASEESCDPATFVVIRTGPTNSSLDVQYSMGGSASNGVDYVTLPGLVTIPAGAWYAPVTVAPIDDFLVEGTESVILALEQPPQWPPPYIVNWPGVAIAEIADNDPPPTNSPPQVALVRPPDGAIFDAYDDIPLLAKAADPDGRVVTVEFFAGTNSLGTVTNRPVLTASDLFSTGSQDASFDLDSNLFPDPDETVSTITARHRFALVWSNAPAGQFRLSAVATDNDGATTRSAPVNITVLPFIRPVVSIRAPDPIATEPGGATAIIDTATFRIHRTGPTNFPLQVFYRIAGTASNGVDYQQIPNSAVIPPGARTVDIVITPLADSLVEGPETVILAIVAPVCIPVTPPPPDCYSVGEAHTARAIIRDNDLPNRPPLVRLVKPDDGEVFLAPADIRLLALARDLDGYVTSVEFFEGTNSLGIVSNSPVASASAVPAFSLLWSNVPPGRYVLTAVATDNDGASTQSCPVEIKVVPHLPPPEVNILTLDGVAAEGSTSTVSNPAVFSVTRSGSTDLPLLVFYNISGTASNGVDYRLLSGRVLIPAGAASNSIVVEPIDDTLVEGLETVILKLEPSPLLTPINPVPVAWYRIGSNDVARAVILDNDVTVSNLPPRVALLRPEDGEVFIAPTDIKLVALAHDPDGWVRTVEFFDGVISLGIVSNNVTALGVTNTVVPSPEQLFWLVWSNAPLGAHALTAKATDNRGATTVSDPVHIRVLPPLPTVVTIVATDPFASEGWLPPLTAIDFGGPVITNLNPKTATFTVYRRGGSNDALTVFYSVGGTASNGVDYKRLPGQVTIPPGADSATIVVVPIDDALPEGTETVVASLLAPLCGAIYPPPPGCYVVGDPHTATAFIFDNDFNRSPKAEIVQPDEGDVFRAFSDIEIDAVAVDPDGWVTKVQFFAGTNLIGEQQMLFIVPPPPGQTQRFSLVWSNVPPGDYSLTVRALDNFGAVSLSDPVHIKVAAITLAPVVTIHADDPIASEPNPLGTTPVDTATFVVERTGSLSNALTVLYRISGTASNGVDYRPLPGVVTIPPNAAKAPIVVVPLDDHLVEGTESVILTLVQPPCITSNTTTVDCYLVGRPDRDIAYIRDNDVSNRPPAVALISPPNGAVFCAPAVIRLVAAASDSDGWVTSVEFFDGSTSLGVVSNSPWVLATPPTRLPSLGTDVVTDHDVTRPFMLAWSNAPAGHHVLTAVATDNAGDSTRSKPVEITVLDSTAVPIVNIMALDAIAREGTSNTATFRIRRVGPTNAPLTVYYAIRGTASNGVDYVAIPNSLTIPAGRHTARILIQPIDDSLPERIETVILRLSPPPGGPDTYQIGRPAVAAAIILDNDCPVPGAAPLADGNIHVPLAVPLGLPYRIEASSDFVNWEAVVIDTASDTSLSFIDADRSSYGQRFFRLVEEFGDLDDD